jgi:hypothetical protein
MHFDFNARGVSGNRFVHGIVQDFREQMVQGALICAAYIHAWSFAYWLQSLKNLNVLGGVGVVKKVSVLLTSCCASRHGSDRLSNVYLLDVMHLVSFAFGAKLFPLSNWSVWKDVKGDCHVLLAMRRQ